MSNQEKNIAERLAQLPPELQDKFLLMAQGAAMAVECARTAEAEAPAENEQKGGAVHDPG